MQELISVSESRKCLLLAELLRTDGFVSGQQLCGRFGISRTAVWKMISQLAEEGYEVESVPRKGYRLVACPDVIRPELVGAYLLNRYEGRMEEGRAGSFLRYYDVTGSTNNDAKRLAEEGAPSGTLVAADCQQAGKGRRGRTWSNPAGTNIAMSLLLRPDIQPVHASMLTLVMGMAAARACKEAAPSLQIMIKWPNDIVCEGKKLSGILTEMSSEVDCINYVVVGIGINANLESFPDEISSTASSLKLLTGKNICRAELTASVMYWFEQYYGVFLKTQDLSGLMDEYNSLLAGKNDRVRVLDPNGEFTGISEGINRRGELLVKTEDGTVSEIYAGEVSVRGIYGYT